MKYILFMILGIIIHISIIEIIDLNEAQRYCTCTLTVKDPRLCDKDASWLYKNYSDRLNLFDCVWPNGQKRLICSIFNIKRIE